MSPQIGCHRHRARARPCYWKGHFMIREIDTLRLQPGQGVFAAQVAHRSQKAHLPSATAPNHTRDTLPAVKRHTHQGKRNGRRHSAKTPGRKGAFSFSVSG